MKTFENLEAWQMARRLAVQVYQTFRYCRDYGFRDQICRSAMSISSNVAEGVERNSPAEFRNFIGVAKGSAGELRSQLILANDLGYISKDNFQRLLDQSVHVSQMLGGLIRSIQNGRTYRLEDRIK
ncbi:MAG: four helix bundle protein [Verrucomicrobia bacterium]|jgi:four helix bundle protein|nr:four helix bundle protein [Verrucomicrobiota bacterium]